MGVQCRGQINIFVYISGNGMANTFYMMNVLRFLFRYKNHRFLFRCKNHTRLQFWFLHCHSFLIKYPKNNAKNIVL